MPVEYANETETDAKAKAVASFLASIDTPCAAYTRMAQRWRLIEQLRSGTPGMRAAGEERLPKEEGETKKQYDARVMRTVLFEGYADTVDDLGGKPFSEEVTVKAEELDSRLALIEDDADYAGTTLTEFCKQLLIDGIDRGLVHLFADYPVNGLGIDRGKELEQALHPYFTLVSAGDLIWWSSRRRADGRRVLTEIRIREWHDWDPSSGVPVNATCNRIRIFREAPLDPTTGEPSGPVMWVLYRRADKSWEVEKEGLLSLRLIPLETAYLRKTGFMQGRPCMEGLAWLNDQHWRASSDHEHSLHYANVPMLYEAGTASGDIAKPIVIGAAKCIRNINPAASLKVVEHNGQSIEAGRKHLQDLEARMEAQGADPLVQGKADVTATGMSIDNTKQMCKLTSWVRSIETLVWKGYRNAATYIAAKLSEDFAVKFFDEFGLPAKAAAECDFLLRQRQARELSRPTFLREVQRRGMYAEDFNAEEEAKAIAAEGPALGEMFRFGRPGDVKPSEDEEYEGQDDHAPDDGKAAA